MADLDAYMAELEGRREQIRGLDGYALRQIFNRMSEDPTLIPGVNTGQFASPVFKSSEDGMQLSRSARDISELNNWYDFGINRGAESDQAIDFLSEQVLPLLMENEGAPYDFLAENPTTSETFDSLLRAFLK